MKQACFLGVLCLLLEPTMVFARTQPSTEQHVVHLISFGLNIHRNMNEGRLPMNWSQLEFNFDYWNEALAERSTDPIQAIYVFVPAKLPMIGYPTGNVVVARIKPIKGGSRVAKIPRRGKATREAVSARPLADARVGAQR